MGIMQTKLTKGRPPKPAHLRREKFFRIAMTNAEKLELQQLALRAGLDQSELVRRALRMFEKSLEEAG
jgi:hypothetical protein